MSGLQKNAKKNFCGGFFFKSTLSILRCTWTGRINLKIFLGYHINYLSIWPFMCHPWFPARKASKLTFVCFLLQLFSTMQGLKNWNWKQINVTVHTVTVRLVLYIAASITCQPQKCNWKSKATPGNVRWTFFPIWENEGEISQLKFRGIGCFHLWFCHDKYLLWTP